MNEYRSALARMALRDLHPDWLPHLDPLMLTGAAASHWGRRWMARVLAPRFTLFAEDARLDAPLDGWLMLPAVHWASWLTGLGALCWRLPLAASPQALQWRRVLGSEVMQRIRFHQSHLDFQPGTLPIMATDALERRLQHTGVIHLQRYAAWQHPLAGERVQLAFPPLLTTALEVPPVPPERVRAYLGIDAPSDPAGQCQWAVV